MTQPIDPRPTWAAFPFEVWFTYHGERRHRACRVEQERDEAVAYLESTEGVTDIEVINRADVSDVGEN